MLGPVSIVVRELLCQQHMLALITILKSNFGDDQIDKGRCREPKIETRQGRKPRN